MCLEKEFLCHVLSENLTVALVVDFAPGPCFCVTAHQNSSSVKGLSLLPSEFTVDQSVV